MQQQQAEKEKIDRFEHALLRASETVGDLTKPSMDLFYRRHPEANEAFKYRGYDKRERLEAEMVDTALYCLMSWLEQPVEVEIILCGSAPHHRDTLKVGPEWYCGLLGSVIDVVMQTIPAHALEDIALFEEIRGDLFGVIQKSLARIAPDIADGDFLERDDI